MTKKSYNLPKNSANDKKKYNLPKNLENYNKKNTICRKCRQMTKKSFILPKKLAKDKKKLTCRSFVVGKLGVQVSLNNTFWVKHTGIGSHCCKKIQILIDYSSHKVILLLFYLSSKIVASAAKLQWIPSKS